MTPEIDPDLQANTVIHIGFPKCASKTLQHLFTIHDKLTYIDNRYTFDLLIPPHPFLWDAARAHRGLSQLLAEARDLGTIPVISDERLIGHQDVMDIAHRLHALMPRAKILICIREQISMLTSFYKQKVLEGSTLSVKDFLQPDNHSLVEFYKYLRTIELYQTLFGKERVHVKLVEEMRDAPERFYADLYRLLGTTPCPSFDVYETHHTGISDLETAQLRLLNFFDASQAQNPFDGLPINELIKKNIDQICAKMTAETVPSLKAEVRAFFQGRFAASNRRLSDRIGINLAAFGYEVASETDGPAEMGVLGEHEERFTLEPMPVDEDYLEHKLVKYQGVLFAWHHSRSVYLSALSQQERDALLQDRDLNTLKAKIAAALERIEILDPAYHDYRILRFRYLFYAVPLASGPVDAARLQALTEAGADDLPDWFIGDSEADCHAFIEDMAALRRLDQQPQFQALHQDLSTFLKTQPEPTNRLFGLPAAETWAYFRLLMHSLHASRPSSTSIGPPASACSLDPTTITEETPLEFALQSRPSNPFHFAARANAVQVRLLQDTPAEIQIALSSAQLQAALGNWDAAQTYIQQTIHRDQITSGIYTALLSYQAALRWMHTLFSEEALRTRTAQQAFLLLRDLNLCFISCPAVQQVLVNGLETDDVFLQAQAYLRLGETLFSADLLKGAEAAFSAAEALTPKSAVVHNNLAVLYWNIAQRTQEIDPTIQALSHIEEALRLDPLNADALVNAQVIVKGGSALQTP